MSEPKPILVINFANSTSAFDRDVVKKMLSVAKISEDYHILTMTGITQNSSVEILSIKEMDIEKQNQILDAVDKLMSKH